MRKVLFLLIIVALATVVGWKLYITGSLKSGGRPRGKAPVAVECEKAKLGNIDDVSEFTGTLEGITEVQVSSIISGIVKSVLVNLINNSYEEVGDEGKIEVGGRNIKQGMIEIWVKDNGSGIKGNLNSIFKNFKSQKKKGTGIGLALVNKIVNEHFGKISVESAEGKGTKFIIEMPTDFHYVDRRSGRERRKSKGRRTED